MVALPGQEGTTSEIVSIIGRNQVIAHPDRMFMFDHGQDVLPLFPLPARQVFRCGIDDKIGQTALAAASAGMFRFAIHHSPDVQLDL